MGRGDGQGRRGKQEMAALHLSEGHRGDYSVGEKQGGNASPFDPIATQTKKRMASPTKFMGPMVAGERR